MELGLKFVMYQDCVSPHQVPLARELAATLGEADFRYVYRDLAQSTRVGMGWAMDGAAPWFVHIGTAPDEARSLIESADCLLTMFRDVELFKRRHARGLKTVVQTERWFKPRAGILRMLSPSYRRMAREFVRLMDEGGVVYLPMGIHAARDMARLCGLMHGDLRCLFRAPKLEFERKPGGRIFEGRVKKEEGKRKREEGSRIGAMRMWGYFVEEGSRKTEEGRRNGFRRRAQEKIEGWLDGVDEHRFADVLDKLLDEKLATGEYKFKGSGGRVAMREGAIRFFRQFSRKIVQLSDGRCVYFTPDERAKRRNADNVASWAEYAIHAVTNGGRRLPGCGYNERWLNYHKIVAFDVLEQTLLLERCAVRFNDDARYDAIMFLGESILGSVVRVIARLDDYGNIDANLTEVTFEASSKRNKKQPRLIPLAEAIEMVVHRQVAAGSNPSTAGIISNLGSGCKGARVLWVGRLLKLKRVDAIIRAVGELSKRVNITLDIYGVGSEEKRLKDMATKYGEAIRFYPSVSIDEVRKLMQEHDLYVFGSNGYEGWGAVVSEALEEGMRVLGTYEAGASATILPKERLFHSGDYKALAVLLEKEYKGELPPCSIGDWTSAKAAERLLEFC